VQVDDPSVPPVSLPGHTGEVTAVAWCPSDYCQIATAADDATLRVWSLDRASARYERSFAQFNHCFSDSQLATLLSRTPGLGAAASGGAAAVSTHGEAAAAAAAELAAATAAMGVADAAAAAAGGGPAGLPAKEQQQHVQRSICSPVTPQMPFWRNAQGAEAAGAGAGPTSTTTAAVAADCITPDHQRCKVGEGREGWQAACLLRRCQHVRT
jgi:hypothetical protein